MLCVDIRAISFGDRTQLAPRFARAALYSQRGNYSVSPFSFFLCCFLFCLSVWLCLSACLSASHSLLDSLLSYRLCLPLFPVILFILISFPHSPPHYHLRARPILHLYTKFTLIKESAFVCERSLSHRILARTQCVCPLSLGSSWRPDEGFYCFYFLLEWNVNLDVII